MDTEADKVRALIEYIARGVKAEPLSGLLPWGPVWNIQAVSLLNEIGRIWEIEEDEIGLIVDRARNQSTT